jgi:hypothetical protein
MNFREENNFKYCTSIDDCIEYYKTEYIKNHSECLLKESTNTITCALASVLRHQLLISKIPTFHKIAEINPDLNLGLSEQINQSHYDNYKICEDASVKSIIDKSVKWISDLKFIASLFANFIVSKRCEEQLQMIPLQTPFFTKIIATVCGRGTDSYFQNKFKYFAKEVNMKYYLPWMTNVSQILEHVKIEMKTVSNTKISSGFEKKTKTMITWILLDFFNKQNESFEYTVLWKKIIYDMAGVVYEYITHIKEHIEFQKIQIKNNIDIKYLELPFENLFKYSKSITPYNSTSFKKKELHQLIPVLYYLQFYCNYTLLSDSYRKPLNKCIRRPLNKLQKLQRTFVVVQN